MENINLKELISCFVCCEIFDQEARRPRVLACGHSFCHSCLLKIYLENPRCPTCKSSILFTTVESIPINFSLESLSSLRLGNGQGPDKKVFQKEVSMMMKKELGKMREKLDLLEKLQTVAESSKSDAEITKAKNDFENLLGIQKINDYRTLSIKDIGTWCRNQSVYAVEEEDGKLLFGRVVMKENSLWVYSFGSQIPHCESKLISFQELLFRFSGSTEGPKRAFFQVTLWGGEHDTFDLVMQTDGVSTISKLFSQNCSALRGSSYKGLDMKHVSSSSNYDSSLYQSCSDVKGVGGGIPYKKFYQLEAGVYESYSRIEIRLENSSSWISGHKIGFVVSGFQKLKNCKAAVCTVTECGVVLYPEI